MNTAVKSVESYWRALMKENYNYLDVKLKIPNVAISKKKNSSKTDHVLAKVYKNLGEQITKPPKHIMSFLKIKDLLLFITMSFCIKMPS